MQGVYLPLQLLGHYCPFPCNTPDGPTSVQIENITFRNIRGTGRRATVGDLDCSPLAPCRNIRLEGVDLREEGKDQGEGTLVCKNADGVHFLESTPSACTNTTR